MKIKVLIPIFFSILIGFLFGKIIFDKYDTTSINAFEEGEKIYMVEIGIFSSEEMAKKQFSDIDNYLLLLEKNNYYLYGGITKNIKTAEKIKEYYLKITNNVNIKEKVIDNKNFLNILSEYDKITLISSSIEDLIGIEKIVISNYKERVIQ